MQIYGLTELSVGLMKNWWNVQQIRRRGRENRKNVVEVMILAKACSEDGG